MWIVPKPAIRKAQSQVALALTQADGTMVYSLSPVERKAIQAIYTAYDALGGQPHPSLSSPKLAQCAQAVHDSYNQVQLGGRLETLRGLLLAAVNECPLCGYGEPTTLDHYLPRSSYQALAIYPRNLIPACQPCNRKKGTGVPKGAKGFIHAYFQHLPEDEIFLHADVAYTKGVLLVTFRVDHPTMPNDVLERLRFQLTKLNLNHRYFAPINTFIFSQKVALQGFKGKNAPKLRKVFLRDSAVEFAVNFGANDWRTALLRGLAASKEFCKDADSYLQRPLKSIKRPKSAAKGKAKAK